MRNGVPIGCYCPDPQLLARGCLESVHLALGIGPRLHEDGITTILPSEVLGRSGVSGGNCTIFVNEVGLDRDTVFEFVTRVIEILQAAAIYKNLSIDRVPPLPRAIRGNLINGCVADLCGMGIVGFERLNNYRAGGNHGNDGACG